MQGPIEKLGQQHLMQDAQLLQPLIADWFVETSLLSALYLPNQYGGGMRKWAWDACSKQLLTCDGLMSMTEHSLSAGVYSVSLYGAPIISLDGSLDYLSDTGGQAYQTIYDVQTVWQWCYLEDDFTTGDRALSSVWHATSNDRSWLLYWDSAATAFRASVSGDGAAVVSVTSTVTVDVDDIGRYYFVAFQYQSGVRMRISVAAATDTSLTTDTNAVGIPAGVHVASCIFCIGNCADPDIPWLGEIGPSRAGAYASTDYLNRVFQLTRRFFQT